MKRRLVIQLNYKSMEIAHAIQLLQQFEREGYTDARISVAQYEVVAPKPKVPA